MEPEQRDEAAFSEALGRVIRVYRAARDLGRRDLAERAGLSYSYLAEIEKGAKYPSTKALYAIAEALGMSPSDLLLATEAMEGTEVAAPESPSDPISDLAAATFGTGSARSPGEGARARQQRWFHSGLLPRRKPAQQDLRLDHDWDPSIDRTLAELRALLRDMLPEDRKHLLELARRLAKR
jgi:transcriptional regulator with XRE-family HTH domain